MPFPSTPAPESPILEIFWQHLCCMILNPGEKCLNRFAFWPVPLAGTLGCAILGLAVPLLSAGAPAAASGPLSSNRMSLVGHLDIEGGGMVDGKGNLAAVGHMAPPYATSLLDVSDPTRPRILSRIRVRPGTHSHKARICGNTLLINVESHLIHFELQALST